MLLLVALLALGSTLVPGATDYDIDAEGVLWLEEGMCSSIYLTGFLEFIAAILSS